MAELTGRQCYRALRGYRCALALELQFEPLYGSGSLILQKHQFSNGAIVNICSNIRRRRIDETRAVRRTCQQVVERLRQEPGPHNSLGAVKINFPNKFMVYMHDTPHRELFGRNVRFESSGCVRIDGQD